MSTNTEEKKETLQPKQIDKGKNKGFGKISVVTVIVGLVAVLLYYRDDPKYMGEFIPRRKQFNQMTPIEQIRWNGSVTYSFPNSKPVPTVKYHPLNFEFAEKLMESEKAYLIKNIPVWPAVKKWDVNYVSKHLPILSVHVPTKSVVRLHQDDQTHPFSTFDEIEWTRPWLEQEVYSKLLYSEPEKLMYSMMDAHKLPNAMKEDVDVNPLTVSYSPPLEVNVWLGTPTLTTPAHYDMVHNFYTQVQGQKRWILFPPEDFWSLYLYTALHPSARQSQINFNEENVTDVFPEFKNVNPIEVILKPGDVLYIPPFWFHYVSAVGSSPSISISTHTESQQSKIRERLMSKREGYFRAVFLKNKNIRKTDVPTVTNLVTLYINGLFKSEDDKVQFIQKLIDSHWSHFEYDNEVIGLFDLIKQGREKFPKDEVIASHPISKGLHSNIASAALEIRNSLDQFSQGVRDIMLANFIEELASDIVGPLNVDPYLRYLVRFNC